jgi:amphi-Trp domain-containing protein
MSEDRDTEVSHEITDFVAELRRLADALESGESYTINVDGEDITIPADAAFSVAHEREDGEVELEFQVTWTLEETDEDEDEDEDEDDGEDAGDEAGDEAEKEPESV